MSQRDPSWYGCIPSLRGHGFQPLATLSAFAPSYDLSQFRSSIKNQLSAGSCTAFAITNLMNYYIKMRGTTYEVDFAQSSLYWWTRFMEGTNTQDVGASLADTIKTAMQYGVGSREYWPYDLTKINEQPDNEVMIDGEQYKILDAEQLATSSTGITSCLSMGHPAAIAVTLFESFESPEVERTGIIPMPGPGEKITGGHAMVIDAKGIKGPNLNSTINQWGEDWGDKGICYFTDGYLDKYLNEAFKIKMVGSDAEKIAGRA